jgi:hypothetical protein
MYVVRGGAFGRACRTSGPGSLGAYRSRCQLSSHAPASRCQLYFTCAASPLGFMFIFEPVWFANALMPFARARSTELVANTAADMALGSHLPMTTSVNAPILESFTIAFDIPPPDVGLASMSDLFVPVLRRLDLAGLLIPFHAPTFTSPSLSEPKHRAGDMSFNLHIVLDMLAACPCLEYLCLARINIWAERVDITLSNLAKPRARRAPAPRTPVHHSSHCPRQRPHARYARARLPALRRGLPRYLRRPLRHAHHARVLRVPRRAADRARNRAHGKGCPLVAGAPGLLAVRFLAHDADTTASESDAFPAGARLKAEVTADRADEYRRSDTLSDCLPFSLDDAGELNASQVASCGRDIGRCVGYIEERSQAARAVTGRARCAAGVRALRVAGASDLGLLGALGDTATEITLLRLERLWIAPETDSTLPALVKALRVRKSRGKGLQEVCVERGIGPSPSSRRSCWKS